MGLDFLYVWGNISRTLQFMAFPLVQSLRIARRTSIHRLLLFIAASDTNNTPVGAAACAGIGFCRNKQN